MSGARCALRARWHEVVLSVTRGQQRNGTAPEGFSGPQPDEQRTRAVFAELARLADDDPVRARLREWLVAEYRPVARRIARRFAHRGQPHDDLEQVALVGLVAAINRFDRSLGDDFLAYAIPTMMGEIRRHFRNHAWAVRPPRRLQDLCLHVRKVASELANETGRASTPSEIARRLQVPTTQVIEAIEANEAFRATSLEEPVGDSDTGTLTFGDTLGAEEPDFDHIENHETLQPLLAALPERERRILLLRFAAGMTQTEIAADVGISQMHVSRLLARTIARLREQLELPDVQACRLTRKNGRNG